MAIAVATVRTGASGADTLRVPSEFPTIQAAVDAASPGDLVLVAPGTYQENVTVSLSNLTLASEIVRGALVREEGAVIVGTGDSLTLSGFAIESTTSYTGSFALALSGDQFLVEDCMLQRGYQCVGIGGDGTMRRCTVSQAMVGIEIMSAAVVLEDCDIVSNSTTTVGGGLIVTYYVAYPTVGSDVTLTGCRFIGNRADIAGGAIFLEESRDFPSRVMIEGCLFQGNSSSTGAVIHGLIGDFTMRSCTVVGNTVIKNNVNGGVVDFEGRRAAVPVVDRCIIAFNDGPGLRCHFGAAPTVSCSDVFGNTDDARCGLDGGNNFSLDPLFCGLGVADFTLQSGSPCAPEHSPGACGLIGALPPTCVSAVTESTWGAIKQRYFQGRGGTQ